MRRMEQAPLRSLRYRRTRIGPAELGWIQQTVDGEATATLTEVAGAVCRRFGWLRPNAEPAAASCVVFLRRLERSGLLRLRQPALRRGLAGAKTRHVAQDEEQMLRALGPLAMWVELQPQGELEVRPIAEEERVGFRLHMQWYHYLGFERSVGESLCYVALVGNELVALLEWGAAVLHNGPRDRWLGWDGEQKARRLAWVVNNRRFLILPWIRKPHLASQVLGANLRRLSRDWEAAYGHRLWLAETFVDSGRFRGTCYQASNWRYVGQTQGFSRTRTGFVANHCPKSVFVYELAPKGAERLRQPGGCW